MTQAIVFDDYVRRFLAFARPYAEQAGQERPTVEIKIDHTFRVLDIATRITEMEQFDADRAMTARLAALFHDTGRFPQFARYGVFNDKASENHASLGVKTLLREGLLEGLSTVRRRLVLGAVFLHNVRHLPDPLPVGLTSAVKVVRDADKLDIMPVILKHMSGTRSINKAVTLGTKPHPDNYSPSILEHFRKREVGDLTNVYWLNDFKLLVLTWVFDFNFPASFRLLDERGDMAKIMDSLPRTAEMDRIREQVREELSARLAPPRQTAVRTE